MGKAKYVVDSSLLLRRNPQEEYEEEAYPRHWQNFDKLVEQGIIVSILEVKKELTKKSHMEYIEWINSHVYMFESLDNESSQYLGELSNKYPEWFEENNRKGSIADAPIIAYSKIHNLVLVTQEVYNYSEDTKQKNYKIPTICSFIGGKCFMKSCDINYTDDQEFDFECICFNELVKREKLYI